MKFPTRIKHFHIPGLLIALYSSIPIFSHAQETQELPKFEGEKIRFKLSATNLPNGDLDGPSDPYVVFFAATQRLLVDRHRHWTYVGSTLVITDTLNPQWNEEFSYQYINGTDQTWRFFVRDHDTSWWNPIYAVDEFLGCADVKVEDFVIEMRKEKEQRKRINDTSPITLQRFLQHPIGGTLLITPLED